VGGKGREGGSHRSLVDALAEARTGDVNAWEAGGDELGLLRQLLHRGDIWKQEDPREVRLEDLLSAGVAFAHHDDVMTRLHRNGAWRGKRRGNQRPVFR